MVHDLQRQVANLRVEQATSTSSPRAEEATPSKVTMQATMPEALDMLRGYAEQSPQEGDQGQGFEPMDFLQDEPLETEPQPQRTHSEDLIDRIKGLIAAEKDSKRKEDLEWELKMLETAKLKFKDVDALYQAHNQTTLPLLTLKLEVEMHTKRLMPKCRMEELGGFEPLTESEINGDEPLTNQPLWRVSWILKYNATIF